MTLNENAAHQFQVDLRGVIDLLSRHIYSGPRVYLRELLQNAVDAIAARRGVDGGGGRVRITPVSAASDEFVLRDDGVVIVHREADVVQSRAVVVEELLPDVGAAAGREELDLDAEQVVEERIDLRVQARPAIACTAVAGSGAQPWLDAERRAHPRRGGIEVGDDHADLVECGGEGPQVRGGHDRASVVAIPTAPSAGEEGAADAAWRAAM